MTRPAPLGCGISSCFINTGRKRSGSCGFASAQPRQDHGELIAIEASAVSPAAGISARGRRAQHLIGVKLPKFWLNAAKSRFTAARPSAARPRGFGKRLCEDRVEGSPAGQRSGRIGVAVRPHAGELLAQRIDLARDGVEAAFEQGEMGLALLGRLGQPVDGAEHVMQRQGARDGEFGGFGGKRFALCLGGAERVFERDAAAEAWRPSAPSRRPALRPCAGDR